jgi:hypothetical protein
VFAGQSRKFPTLAIFFGNLRGFLSSVKLKIIESLLMLYRIEDIALYGVFRAIYLQRQDCKLFEKFLSPIETPL